LIVLYWRQIRLPEWSVSRVIEMMNLNAQPSKLHGQVAIVTGGGSGIGRATCAALVDEGAIVIVVDVDTEAIQRTVDALAQNGSSSHLGLTCDLRHMMETEEMTRTVLARFGGIDILVHCAGILRLKGTLPKPLVELTTAEWDAVLDTNLKGTFNANRAVLPSMIAKRRGHIINLSSTSGRQGRAHDSAYCASKFGVIGVSEAIAEEVRSYGVKVQVVLPDAVNTPFWQQNGPIPPPSGALSPERVADLIVYLLKMPEDTILVNPVIAPFRTRKRVQHRQASA
jgi:NAD(P)-dependent dehydrogenase (short-subunit alcohol dehydrogenase family)